VGNRLYQDFNGARTTYVYNAANQLGTEMIADGGGAERIYFYDNAGNLRNQDIKRDRSNIDSLGKNG
jgi:hypothetical protein